MDEIAHASGGIIPRRLRPVPDRLKPLAHGIWWLFAAIALVSAVGGSWSGWVAARSLSPAFHQVGLSYSDNYDGTVSVDALTAQARRSGPLWPGTVVAVGGKPAPRGPAALARALTGPPGAVTLAIDDQVSPIYTITLPRSRAVQREATGTTSPVPAFLLETGVPLVAAIAMLGCAALIFRRRRRDPVALLLSMALLCGTTALIGTAFWIELGLDRLDHIASVLFFGLLIVVITAFPDGAFRSRWAGIVALAAVPLTLLLAAFPSDSGLAEATIVLLLLAVIALPYRRYRRTAPGIARQQLKWAAFGLIGAAVFLIVAGMLAMAIIADAFPPSWAFGANMAVFGIAVLSLVVLAVATTVAILRISLWDADAAIGRSAGLGALTVALGGIWAACAILANQLAEALLGAESKALAAGVSAVIAGTVLGPARTRVTTWIDRRFAGDVRALAALPEQIRVWQQSDTADDIGRRVTVTVAQALGATRSVLLVWRDDRFVTVAAKGAGDTQLAEWIAERVDAEGDVNETAPGDPLFPIRLNLTDGSLPIGLLLIGGRPQGAGLAKDVRAALHDLRTPIAAALRQANGIERRDEAVLQMLRSLEQRLGRLEAIAQG